MQSDIIEVKIIRHSNRLDFSNPIKWMFYFGHYWSDSPLTEAGYANAKEKGVTLSMDGFVPKTIYSSPYNRTVATSTQIKTAFPGAEIIVEPLLAEYQPRYAHTISLYPNGIPTIYEGNKTPFSYPETLNSFSNRVQFIISELIKKSHSNIMIVTHGEILKSYISYLQNLFPNLLLDSGTTPYLTVISFSIDKTNSQFVPGSIRLE